MEFLDIVIIAILLLFGIGGFLKGFIKGIFGLASTLVSAFLSSQLAQMMAPGLSERVIEVGMKNVFLGIIPDVDLTGIPTTIESVALALQEYGIPRWMVDTVAANIAQRVEEGAAATGEALREMIAQSMAHAIALSFTRLLLFVVLFFVILLLLQLLQLALDTVFKLPVLNLSNRVGGLVLGLIQGALVCGVVCVVVSLIVLYTAGEPDAAITMETINATRVFRHFYNNPIIELFLFQKG